MTAQLIVWASLVALGGGLYLYAARRRWTVRAAVTGSLALALAAVGLVTLVLPALGLAR